MKGRKPKPTHLKVLDGNPGKRPINKNEPKPEPLAPACPAFLDAVAKAEWKYIAPKLEKLGLLTKIDRAALAAYCICWSDLKAARMFLNEHGLTYTTTINDKWGRAIVDKEVAYPQVKIQRDAIAQINKLAAEFGMTVSSRSRLTVPGGDEQEDDMEQLLSRG